MTGEKNILLTSKKYEEHRAFWRQQLSLIDEGFRFAGSRSRPELSGGRREVFEFSLQADGANLVRGLSGNKDLGLLVVVLSALELSIAKYTGAPVVALNTPLIGSGEDSEPQTEHVLLVERVDQSLTARAAIVKAKETVSRSYKLKGFPLELAADSGRANVSGLTNCLLYFPKIHGRIERLESYEFVFEVSAAEQEIYFRIIYDPAIFDEPFIASFAATFETILGSYSNLDAKVQDIHLMPEADRHRLLYEFNNTATGTATDKAIHELFEQQAEKTPDQRAVVFEEKSLTYRELNERANMLARHMRSRFMVKPDDLIGIMMNRSELMVIGLLAALKAGCAYVPIDPTYPQDRISFIFRDARLKALLVESETFWSVEGFDGHLFAVDLQFNTISESPENSSVDLLPENLAYVIYTSGSTGEPKGVMINHSSLVNHTLALSRAQRLAPLDRHLQFVSLSFDASAEEIFPTLISGATLVLHRNPGQLSGPDLLSFCRQQDVSVLHVPPALWHQVVDDIVAQRATLAPSVRTFLTGGEGFRLDKLREFAEAVEQPVQVLNAYGPTEATITTTFYETYGDHQPDARDSYIPIGKPIANAEIFVLDQQMQLVPVGVGGELFIAGAGVARGYLNRPDLTADRFIPNAYATRAGDRVYRTGDVVRYLRSGDIEFIGRTDQQVKLRGYRIELAEIEAVLSREAGVTEAAVIVKQSQAQSKQLVAYVVGEGSWEELKRSLSEKVPDYMVPSKWVRVERMPLTPNGKVDRRALEEVEWSDEQDERQYVAPETDLERVMVEIWKNVLNVEEVGVEDNFFRMGGDSIKSIKVVAQSQEKGIKVKVEELFQYQTVRRLAEAVQGQEREEAEEEKRTEAMSLVSRKDRERMGEEIEDAYPVTRLQAGMIFHTEMSPESAVYHSIMSLHVEGEMRVEKLEKAVEGMVKRHAMLRTSFDLDSYSEAMQMVHREVKLRVEEEDVRGMSEEEKEGEIRRWIEEESKRRFEWKRVPLMRIVVHRRTDHTFQFSFSIPHAVIDGWSNGLFLTELMRRYTHELEGRGEWEEEELKSSYRDYVAAELEALKSEESKEYWRKKIETGTATRLPRLKSQEEGIGRTVTVELSEEIYPALDKLSQRLKVSPKAVLLAAHIRVMALATGQKEVLTGLVMDGRLEQPFGEQVIGLFVNTMPFYMRLEEETWEELVRRVFEEERQMLTHRRYPLSEIQRERGGEELFETGFNFTRFHVFDAVQDITSLKVLGNSGFSAGNFTLMVSISASLNSSAFRVGLSYNSGVLTDEQVEAMAGYYKRALTALAINPQGLCNSECLLSEQEQQQILLAWNSTASDYPANLCIHEMIERQAEIRPSNVAVEFEGEQISYSELNRRANRLARYLIGKNVGPEVSVGLCVERGINLVIGVLGILKAGGAYVPLDPAYPRERLAYMAEDAKIGVLVSGQGLEGVTGELDVEVVNLDEDWAEIAFQSDEKLQNRVGPENLAYVIYTSGSTGQPKGVDIEHSSVVNLLTSMSKTPGMREGERLMAVTSLSFDMAVPEIYLPLVTGGTIVMMLREEVSSPEAIREKLKRMEVGVLQATPATWRMMIESGWEGAEGLRAFCGAEALSRELAEELSRRSGEVWNLYGPTETTVWSSIKPVTSREEVEAVIGIGTPIDNTQIYIMDEQQQIVPVGVIGELYIGGDGLARGYRGRAGSTAERFVPDPYGREPGSRLYRTGDLARFLPDGNIQFIGRTDNQVKLHSFRIELGEIEAALATHPGVAASVVVVREDVPGDRQLVAYVVSQPGIGITNAELRIYLREKLPAYMVPSIFVGLQRLPLTLNGKINRRALPVPGRVIWDAEKEIANPRNEIESALAEIWSEVLRTGQISIHDNFFDIGGYSLLATQIISRVKRRFEIDLPLRTLIESPTIAELGIKVEASLEAQRADLGKISRILDLLEALPEEEAKVMFDQQ